MKKEKVLKLALMGLAAGSAMGGCSTPTPKTQSDHSACGKHSCASETKNSESGKPNSEMKQKREDVTKNLK
jgi:hypothetical protein